MRSKLATVALAGAIGLTGLGGAAVLAPAVSYAATGDSTALTSRVTSIKDALSGLVTDGSITQAQADEVATTLAEARPEGGGRGGHGGRGGGGLDLAAAAEALGLTEDELRTKAAAGQSLADVADAEGVDQADLVAALVASAQARLDAAVTDGRLTQEQADERSAELSEKITARLDEVRPPGGRGGRGGPGERDDAATPEPSSSDAQTPTTGGDA